MGDRCVDGRGNHVTGQDGKTLSAANSQVANDGLMTIVYEKLTEGVKPVDPRLHPA